MWETSKEALTLLADRLDNSISRHLAPPPRLSGSEWANKYHILASENSAEPGKYRWQRAPYQREILDVCTDREHNKVVLMMSARTGKTLALLNTIGYYAHQDPSPLMVLGPTNGYCEGFSKTSIEPLFYYSKELRDIINWETRDKSNTIKEKKFAGGSIYLTGAESPSGLRGRTIRVLLADEVDAFPDSSGDEGDPIALAEVRTTTFQHRSKIILASTPLIKDLSVIEREYEISDKRIYVCPCPKCGSKQKLIWENLNYSDGDPKYICFDCGYNIPENKKQWMLDNGEWIKTNPESKVAGFHINALYSPFQSWGSLVDEWKQCKNNVHLLQRFLNTRLGQTWDSSGDRIVTNDLMRRLEEYSAQIPAGVGVITAGVDVQQSPGRIEVSVWGWGADNESWLIDHQAFEGDVNRDDVWNQLKEFIIMQKYYLPNNIPLRLKSVAIDSGFLASRVYDFVEEMGKAQTKVKVFTVKGRDSYNKIVDDIPRKSKKYGAPLRLVGTDMAKDFLVGLLNNAEAGPNYVHIPVVLPIPRGMKLPEGEQRWLTVEYLDQLTAERPKLEIKNGKRSRKWVLPPGKRNEALDCWVYAYAALRVLGLKFFNDLGDRAKKLAEYDPQDIQDDVVAPTEEDRAMEPFERKQAKKVKKKGLTVHRPSSFGSIFR